MIVITRLLSFTVLLLLVVPLLSCGAAKKPPLTPEEQARIQQERQERKARLRLKKIEEARELGLLNMSYEEKASFMKSFLSRLRAKQVSGKCDLVTDIAYYDPEWYLLKCKNGYDFIASVDSRDKSFLAMQSSVGAWGGIDFDLGVWFIGDHKYPEPE